MASGRERHDQGRLDRKKSPFLHGKENEIFCEISRVFLRSALSRQHKFATFGRNHEVSKIPRQLLMDGKDKLFLVVISDLALGAVLKKQAFNAAARKSGVISGLLIYQNGGYNQPFGLKLFLAPPAGPSNLPFGFPA
ncbi:hypothetical protein [Agrobacterium vitis]|uniref:Uncharacterized protein n=1 Tax=Agrobacterium vitis TaxID=373 RepID=A0AAE2RDS3_AGRVI|nr:hypothetical protein [Agrobacterium vitis]MBF2715599.1 hypothetical protein [Agrobacterium vitis]